MGLFKGMKDISKLTKQAKELQRQQQVDAGYEPGMRGTMRQMEDQIGQVSEMLSGMTGQKADQARLMAVGMDAVGIVIAMGTPARGASMYNLDIDLQVEVPGRAPYRVANQYMVPSSAQLGPGVRLPLKVAPEDPRKIVIVWDQAASAPERGVIRPVGPEPSGAAPFGAAPFAAAPAAPAHDRLAQLERLAGLHAAGALTDAEFARMKAEILGT